MGAAVPPTEPSSEQRENQEESDGTVGLKTGEQMDTHNWSMLLH